MIVICCVFVFGIFELQKNVCFLKVLFFLKDVVIDVMIEKIVEFWWRFLELFLKQFVIYIDFKIGM